MAFCCDKLYICCIFVCKFQLAMFTSVARNTTQQTYVSCLQSWHQQRQSDTIIWAWQCKPARPKVGYYKFVYLFWCINYA